jgi:hypothetical protein
VYWGGGAEDVMGATEDAEGEPVPEVTLDAVVAELLPELELDGCAVAEDPESDTIESPLTI